MLASASGSGNVLGGNPEGATEYTFEEDLGDDMFRVESRGDLRIRAASSLREVDGEDATKDGGYDDKIEVLSWSWGETNG